MPNDKVLAPMTDLEMAAQHGKALGNTITVLASGGLDSFLATGVAARIKKTGAKVQMLHFSYPLSSPHGDVKHVETACVEQQAAYLRLPLAVLPMPAIWDKGKAKTGKNAGRPAHAPESAAFEPMRNAVMLSIAYARAVARGGPASIVTGIWSDVERDENAYPDATQGFLANFQYFAERASGYALWKGEKKVTSRTGRICEDESSVTSRARRIYAYGSPKVVNIFGGLDKGAVLRTAMNCGLDIEAMGRMAHTSYEMPWRGNYLMTATDQTRAEAYIEAGVMDPLWDPAFVKANDEPGSARVQMAAFMAKKVWPAAANGNVAKALAFFRQALQDIGGVAEADVVV